MKKQGFSTTGQVDVYDKFLEHVDTNCFEFPKDNAILSDTNRFHTKLTISDGNGVRQSFSRLCVTVPEPCSYCVIQDRAFFDANNSHEVFTDASGEVTIQCAIPEHTLSLDPLTFKLHYSEGDNESHSTFVFKIDISNFINDHIRHLDAAKLKKACEEKGEVIGVARFEQVSGLCDFVKRIVASVESRLLLCQVQSCGSDTIISDENAETYDSITPSSSLAGPLTVTWSCGEASSPVFESSVETSDHDLSNAGSLVTGVSMLWDWICGFLDPEGGVIVKWDFCAVTNGLHIVCHYLHNFFEKAKTFVVSTWRDIRNLFSMLWQFLKLKWEGFLNYLGYLCDWNHIVLTKELFKVGMTSLFDAMDELIVYVNEKSDDAIKKSKGLVESLINDAKAAMSDPAAKRILDDASTNELSGQMNKSMTASSIQTKSLNALKNTQDVTTEGSSSVSFLSHLSSLAEDVSMMITEIKALCSEVSGMQEWEDAVDHFKAMSTPGSKPGTELIVGLLDFAQGIVKTLLSGIGTIVTIGLKLFRNIVKDMKYLLFEMKITLPVVSDFYERTVGAPLTFGDLVCLVIAIPTTICAKLVLEGDFPLTDSIVHDCAKLINAQTIIGLCEGTDPQLLLTQGMLDMYRGFGLEQYFSVCGTVSSMISSYFCLVSDTTLGVSVGHIDHVEFVMKNASFLYKNSVDLFISAYDVGTFVCTILQWLSNRHVKWQVWAFSIRLNATLLVLDIVPLFLDMGRIYGPLCSLLFGLASIGAAVWLGNIRIDAEGNMAISQEDMWLKIFGGLFTTLRASCVLCRSVEPFTHAIGRFVPPAANLLIVLCNVYGEVVYLHDTCSNNGKQPFRFFLCRC